MRTRRSLNVLKKNEKGLLTEYQRSFYRLAMRKPLFIFNLIEDAVKDTETKCKRIFAKWKERGLV